MSEVTKEQAQKYDLTTLQIWGPETIIMKDKDDEVHTHDIHEMIKKRQERLDVGVIISEAKLQVQITGNVKLDDIREYLSRFFDYTVVDVDMNYYSYLWELEAVTEFPTPWGTTVKSTSRYNELYDSIQKAIKKQKPSLKEAFEFLISIPIKGTTAFDRVRSMIFVKHNIEPDPVTGRYSHALVFGCSGDCQPMLSVTSSQQDFEEFISFFQSKGYGVTVHLCTVELSPKTVDKYYTVPAEGYERKEQCAV